MRLRWSPHDYTRLTKLHAQALSPKDRRFIDDMQRLDAVTLQQVALVRSLARRYRADVEPTTGQPRSARHIDLDDG